jgi:hypothetical protein
MGTGTIIDIALWAGCGTCALEAVAAYARLARAQDGHRDAGSWHAPLIFTSGTFALLGIIGVLAPAVAAVLAAGPLLAVLRIVWRAWREAARALGTAKATAIVLGGLLSRVREALWHTREDLRDLRGLRAQAGQGTPGASPAGIPPAAALRSVPSVRESGNLGGTPAPAEVAAGLTAAGVEVPPVWQALIRYTAEFEPEGKDDLLGHMAGDAAGMLAWADAKEAQAETLLNVPKLHPAYVAGQLEVADGAAELAVTAAQADRRYYEVYGDIEDWHDEGNELPEDARNWGFGDGAGAA